MKYGVAEALVELKPGAKWSCLGNVYSGITWLDSSQTIPTEEQVTAKIAEIKAAEPMTLLRDERNILLAQTDFTQLGDIGLSDSKKAEWVSYRKALRDLPSVSNPKLNSFGDLDMSSVSWPSKPS